MIENAVLAYASKNDLKKRFSLYMKLHAITEKYPTKDRLLFKKEVGMLLIEHNLAKSIDKMIPEKSEDFLKKNLPSVLREKHTASIPDFKSLELISRETHTSI